MNKKQILNKLLKVEKIDDLNLFLDDLKREVYMEEKNKPSSYKSRVNAVLKFLKKADRYGVRPVLNYANTVDNIQYVTDTYIAFAFKQPLEELPEYSKDEKNKSLSYPNVGRLFENANNDCQKLDFDVDDFYKKFKAKMYVSNDPDEKRQIVWIDDKKGLNAKFIEDIIKILGTTDLKVETDSKKRTVLFTNLNTGDQALACTLMRF